MCGASLSEYVGNVRDPNEKFQSTLFLCIRSFLWRSYWYLASEFRSSLIGPYTAGHVWDQCQRFFCIKACFTNLWFYTLFFLKKAWFTLSFILFNNLKFILRTFLNKKTMCGIFPIKRVNAHIFSIFLPVLCHFVLSLVSLEVYFIFYFVHFTSSLILFLRCRISNIKV